MKLLAVIAMAARSLGTALFSAEGECYVTIDVQPKRRTGGWSYAANARLAVLLLLFLPFVCVVTGTSAPALSYALTTTVGPVTPGQGIQFTVTVTNLSSASQFVYLYYDVPQFTTSNGYPAGTALSYGLGYVAGGATQVVSLDFRVLSGPKAPPDGSLVTLLVSDPARSASVSCGATVRSVPAPVLELSTPQSPVTSAGTFSYTLAYHNATASALSNAQLSLPVPAGASFVSADGGGVLGTDGVVRWTLRSVAAAASGEVNISLKAPSTPSAHAPLVVTAALRNSVGQILAQTSDAKAIYVTPALSYALTTTANPVQPGQGIEFTVTVTNLSSVSQFVYLYYDVPQFTTSNGYPAGTALSYGLGYVAAGATQVVSLDFRVLSGSQAPPDGSLITAVVSDRANGGLVSCTATVRSVPAPVLELSTTQSPVTPAGTFSYTLAYHNATASELSNAQLSLPVPAGASFVSADGGGVLGTDGVVRWTLRSVAAAASGEVKISLKAPSTSSAHAPLVVTAALRNSVGQILAQASDAKAFYVTRALSYLMTTTANPARPGQVVPFLVKVTNLSSVSQFVYLYYDVPQFTTSNGYPAGTALSYGVGYVAAGATQSVTLNFTVLSGSQTPPNGSLITLAVSDRAHGALVSLTVAVKDTLAMLERPGSLRNLVWANPSADVAGISPLIDGKTSDSVPYNRGANPFREGAGLQTSTTFTPSLADMPWRSFGASKALRAGTGFQEVPLASGRGKPNDDWVVRARREQLSCGDFGAHG